MRDTYEPTRRYATCAARAAACIVVICSSTFATRAAAQESGAAAALGHDVLSGTITRSSPELQALRAELESARARAAAAGYAGPVVLSGEIEDVPNGYDIGGAAIRVELGREFLTGGRSTAARALAAADVAAAEASLQAAGRRLEARVVQELTRLWTAKGTARRLAGEDSLLFSAEGSLRARFSVGEARYVDVLRLRTERLRIQTDRADAVADARVAREALLGLGGPDVAPLIASTLDSLTATSARWEEPLPPVPSLDSLLALSGDVRMAEATVQRARATLDVVRAEQRPRLAASVGAQRTVGESGNSRFGPVLGASVSLPFTRRHANESAELAAERQLEAARAARAAVVATVRASLAGSLVRYEAARERLAEFDATLLRGAREERESALAAYRTGNLSLIELLDFERALARAEIERLRARAQAAEAFANLIAASSGGR
ncbi:MAG: TolC family protein [Gemmatimonadota bacterium]